MRVSHVISTLVLPVCLAQTTPLRVIGRKPSARSISILRVDLQELKFGREGPSYFSTKRAPFRGKQEIVEVGLFGQDAISTVRFDLVGEGGQILGSPAAVRTGSGADADEYLLLVDVPVQSFRFRIRGDDTLGQPYERVYQHLFVPIDGSAPSPELPEGLSEQQSALFRNLLSAHETEMRARFRAARQEQPDGVIHLSRSEVLESNYEPLLSTVGNTIGLRLHFVIRFGADGDYGVRPQAAPRYTNSDWREITMQVMDAEVDPAPQVPSGVPVGDVIKYGGAAHYLGNLVYRFTFDMVPSYVIRNADRTRYCINLQSFRYGSRMRIWGAVQASTAPVKYHISISSLDFDSETAELPPQHIYYESFLREGAGDCGPTPTIHF